MTSLYPLPALCTNKQDNGPFGATFEIFPSVTSSDGNFEVSQDIEFCDNFWTERQLKYRWVFAAVILMWRVFVTDGVLIGGMLFTMDNFPSLNEAAKIFYTGTHENRFLRRKILKKRTENCLRNTGFFFILPLIYRFSCGFHEILLVWTTTPTPTHKKMPILP